MIISFPIHVILSLRELGKSWILQSLTTYRAGIIQNRQVHLRKDFGESGENLYTHFCGGTIIDKTTILTGWVFSNGDKTTHQIRIPKLLEH